MNTAYGLVTRPYEAFPLTVLAVAAGVAMIRSLATGPHLVVGCIPSHRDIGLEICVKQARASGEERLDHTSGRRGGRSDHRDLPPSSDHDALPLLALVQNREVTFM
ncbi:hypothetical protein [Nonomuraea sp. NPDC003201]